MEMRLLSFFSPLQAPEKSGGGQRHRPQRQTSQEAPSVGGVLLALRGTGGRSTGRYRGSRAQEPEREVKVQWEWRPFEHFAWLTWLCSAPSWSRPWPGPA